LRNLWSPNYIFLFSAHEAVGNFFKCEFSHFFFSFLAQKLWRTFSSTNSLFFFQRIRAISFSFFFFFCSSAHGSCGELFEVRRGRHYFG
jgi:hypothetical protein